MPKKRTAFVYFMMEHRKTLPQDIAKEQAKVSESAGKAWGEMSEAAKAPFNALAEADKARYEEELAAYEAKKRAERKSLGAGGWCWRVLGCVCACLWCGVVLCGLQPHAGAARPALGPCSDGDPALCRQ